MRPTVSCPRCGTSNRIDARRLERDPRRVCRRCRAKRHRSSDVVEIIDSRFEEQVLASPLPVLLDVWAPWCVPGRGMEPVIDELASSLAGRVRVAKLNVDRSPDAAARLRIDGVPTVIVFKAGHEVMRMNGARGKAELIRALAGVA